MCPVTATNNQDAPVRLTAAAIDPVTSLAWVNDASADNPAVVQIVVANDDAFVDDTFHIQTATLGVTKSSEVITDNLVPPSANPKAIPGATVEYTITIANTGSQAATLQTLSDSLPATTTFRADEYPGAMDVSIQVDANPVAYCTSDCRRRRLRAHRHDADGGCARHHVGRRRLHGHGALPRHHQLIGRS